MGRIPTVADDQKKLSIRQAHSQHVAFARVMLSFRLLRRQRRQQNDAAVATVPVSGEANLTRLLWRLLPEPGRSSDPWDRRKGRLTRSPRALRNRQLDRKRRGFPD